MSVQSMSLSQSLQLSLQETVSQSRIYFGHLYQWLANSQIARHSNSIIVVFTVASFVFAIIEKMPQIFPTHNDGYPLSNRRVSIRQNYDNLMRRYPRFAFCWHNLLIDNLPTTIFFMTLSRLTESNPAELAYSLRPRNICIDIYLYSITTHILRIPAGLFWRTVRNHVPGRIGEYLSFGLWLVAPRGF